MPFVDHYSITDYNAGPINRDISQAPDGILYFANSQGLLRYDGTVWELFKIEPGHKVLSTLVDKGKIYVGVNGGFGYFENGGDGRLVYHSLSDELEENYTFGEIVRIDAINDLIYFFTYSDCVFVWNGESLNTFNIANINSAASSKDGLVVSVIGKGLSILDDNGLTTLCIDDRVKYITLAEIMPTSKNRMLIFSLGPEIYALENGKLSPWAFSHPEILEGAKIADVVKTQDGKYLVGTTGAGILEVDETGKLLKIYNKDNGLNNNAVHSLFQDNYGNVWVAHSDGISKIDYNSSFTKIDNNLGIQGAGKCVAKHERDFYLGTFLGLYKHDSHTGLYELVPHDEEGRMLSLEQIGDRFFAGRHRGVCVYNEGEFEKVSNWMGSWKIMEVPNYEDKIVFGGYGGIQILNIDEENNAYLPCTESSEPQGSSYTSCIDFRMACRVMEFDDRGYLWVTSKYKGIHRLKINFENDSLEEVKFYDGAGVFPSKFFTNVFKINNELVFTGDSGVFQFNYAKDQFEVSEKFKKYFDCNLKIRELEEDHLGNIYYSAFPESGIITNPGKDNQRIVKKPFYRIAHFLSSNIVDYTFLDEHNVFLDASEGFIHFDPHQITQQIDSFSLYIR